MIGHGFSVIVASRGKPSTLAREVSKNDLSNLPMSSMRGGEKTSNKRAQAHVDRKKPICDKCGAASTRFNFGPGEPRNLCETDWETYKASHDFLEIAAWLRLGKN
jgi:hypothetical protein